MAAPVRSVSDMRDISKVNKSAVFLFIIIKRFKKQKLLLFVTKYS